MHSCCLDVVDRYRTQIFSSVANMSSGWCTVESDPGVFSELLSSVGVKGVYCEEIWSLEDRESIEALKPIYGLVFLFKYKTGV